LPKNRYTPIHDTRVLHGVHACNFYTRLFPSPQNDHMLVHEIVIVETVKETTQETNTLLTRPLQKESNESVGNNSTNHTYLEIFDIFEGCEKTNRNVTSSLCSIRSLVNGDMKIVDYIPFVIIFPVIFTLAGILLCADCTQNIRKHGCLCWVYRWGYKACKNPEVSQGANQNQPTCGVNLKVFINILCKLMNPVIFVSLLIYVYEYGNLFYTSGFRTCGPYFSSIPCSFQYG
jgi:hypothetical protein